MKNIHLFKKLVFLFCVCLFFSLSTQAEIANSAALKTDSAFVEFKNQNQDWNSARTLNLSGSRLVIYIPKDQTLQTWTKAIVASFYPYTALSKNISLKQFNQEYGFNNFKIACEKITQKDLQETDNSIFYEGFLTNCDDGSSSTGNRIVIGRILKERKGISYIYYTVKTNKLQPEQKQEMLHLVESARFKFNIN